MEDIRVFRTPGAHRSHICPLGRLPLRAYPEVMNLYEPDFRHHDLDFCSSSIGHCTVHQYRRTERAFDLFWPGADQRRVSMGRFSKRTPIWSKSRPATSLISTGMLRK